MCFSSLRFLLSVTLILFSGASPLVRPAHAEDSYQQLRLQFEMAPFSSVAQIHNERQKLSGKIFELQGVVTGTLTRDGQKSIFLKIGHESALFALPPQLSDSPLLRAGVLIRVLAQLQKEGNLALLAATPGIAATPLPKPDAASTLPLESTESTSAAPVDSLPQAPSTSDTSIQTSSQASLQPRTAADNLFSLPQIGTENNQETIQAQIPAYLEMVQRHNKKLKPEVVKEIATAILRAGFQYNMDPRFLAAIIAVESDFDVYCLSKSGAMGLGQLMPFNLKEAGVKNAWNPTENIMGTAKLLRGHLDDYKDRPNSTLLAVAAYNAGPGAVRRAGYKVPNGAQVQRHVWKVYYRYKAFAPDLF